MTGELNLAEFEANGMGLMPTDGTIVDEIVKARNELFHEALWEGEKPGFKLTQARYTCLNLLKSSNQRVLLQLSTVRPSTDLVTGPIPAKPSSSNSWQIRRTCPRIPELLPPFLLPPAVHERLFACCPAPLAPVFRLSTESRPGPATI